MPRTRTERDQLLEERPAGWEYLLFAAELLRRQEELEPNWRAHEAYERSWSDEPELTPAEANRRVSLALQEAREIPEPAVARLSPAGTEWAFGKLGEDGHAERIVELADAVMRGYEELLAWSDRMRGQRVPLVFREVYDRASDVVNLPLKQFRAFVNECVEAFDDLPAAIQSGRPIKTTLMLSLSIDETDMQRFYAELESTSALLKSAAETVVALGETATATPSVPAELPRAGVPDAGATPAPGHRGLLARRRDKKAEKAYEAELADWQEMRNGWLELLVLAQSFQGDQAAPLMLKPGEAVFASVSGASLIEERRTRGDWQGRSSGFSFPVGSIGGRSVRYRVGGTRGTFAAGVPVPTAIEVGSVYITNKRVIFQGRTQTRECLFDKLVGYQNLADGSTVFSVSNRQRATVISYGSKIAGWFAFRLDLALAHYRNDVPALVDRLQQGLAEIDAEKPAAPAT